MFKNLILFALIGIITQESEARPSISVLLEYAPKLANISLKFVGTIAHGKSNISRCQDFIEGIVDNAQTTVNSELTNLNEAVAKAQAEAEQAKDNITECVTEELSSIENIDFSALDQCRVPDSVRNLYADLLKLAKDGVSFAAAGNMCILKHLFDGIQLAACFDVVIQKAEEHIAECNGIIDDALMTAKYSSMKCIENILAKLYKEISGVSNKFNTCVQK